MKTKAMLNFLIRNIDLQVGNIAMRILLTVVSVIFLFSSLNLMTSHYQKTSQIKYIERAFENKEPRMMRHVISKCSGSLYHVESMKACQQGVYNNLIGAEKSKRLKIKIYFVLWFIALGLFSSGYIYLANKQQQFRQAHQNESEE